MKILRKIMFAIDVLLDLGMYLMVFGFLVFIVVGAAHLTATIAGVL